MPMLEENGVPVVVDDTWPRGAAGREDGRIVGHCLGCMRDFIRDFDKRYAIVMTVPPCVLERASGELLDVQQARPFEVRFMPPLVMPPMNLSSILASLL